ncbi:MAG: protein arginine kinase [Lentisphaeria bacterium]|nr:protein arginine kinase [Lentisphaeria bacterium]
MNDDITRLIASPVSFLADSGPDDDIAISSRIRLARNLAGWNFIEACDAAQLREIGTIIADAATASGALGCPECFDFKLDELDEIDREVLFERRLASRDLLNRPEGARLLIRPDEASSVMINEEDHLRIQSLSPGFQLDAVWQEINRLDDQIAAELDYAFDDRLGYLTSCPTNVGTGMRASVMLHLPGMTLTGELTSTVQGVTKLGFAVRGIAGEGSDNRGNLFQISNQSTLGESETDIIERLSQIISTLIAHEKQARRYLLEKEQPTLLDWVGRSYGTLRYAYVLSTEDALNSLSGVRLGVDLGMFSKLNLHIVNELFREIYSAHLQKKAGTELSPDERDIARATLCRERLAHLNK